MNKLESIFSFLAGHYIERFPKEAARILETQQNLAQIKSFIAKLNIVQTRLIFTHMNSHLAQECLSEIELEKTYQVLEEIPPEKAATILRLLRKVDREKYLSGLRKKNVILLRALVSFPPDSAGAMMDPHVFEVAQDLTVLEVKKAIKRFSKKVRQFFYVVDTQGILQGRVSLFDFLQSADETSIHGIMEGPEPYLFSGATSQEILLHLGWRDFPELPVVDESRRILGVLSYQVMQRLQKKSEESFVTPKTTLLRLMETGWIGMMAACQHVSEIVQENLRSEK